MKKVLVLFTILFVFFACGRMKNRVIFVDSASHSVQENSRSAYGIEGWLTDFECVADIDGVNDVIRFSHLIQNYEGEGLVKDEFGYLRFKTVEELGLSDNPEVKYLPNGKWTGMISEANWVPLKTYVESKL